MPFAYNPGVSDISGQLRAQGIESAGRSYAAGISSLGNTAANTITAYQAKQEQNKALEGQTKALKTLLPEYFKAAGYDQAAIDAALQSSPDESPKAYGQRLATTLEGVVTTQTLKSKQLEAQQLQTAIAGDKQRQAMLADEQERQKTARDALGSAIGATPGGVTPETINAYVGQAGGAMNPRTVDTLQSLVGPRVIDVPGGPKVLVNGRDATPLRAPAPVPGAAGYTKQEVPGMGTMLIDNATGEPVDSGKIQRPDRKSDEKALTAQEIQQLQALQQSERDLKALEAAYGDMKDPNWGGPVAARVRGAVSMGTDTNLSRIDGLVTAATPNLARGVFREVGVLTDEDVKRYKALLPSATDTAEQRQQKFKDLRSRLTDSRREALSTLKAAGRDVAGLEEKLAAESAIAKPDKSNAAAFPEFRDAAGVQSAIAAGKLQRGSVVRVNGQLVRVR